MEYKEFVDLVEKMRRRQKDWFAHHCPEDLRISRALEKAVDRHIAEFKEGQQSLF